MDLLKVKQVQSSRDTGVGMWVQELGVKPIASRFPLLSIYGCMICSMEGLLHSCHVCLAASVDGQTVPGKVYRHQMGGQRGTLQRMEGRKNRRTNR